MTDDDWDFGAMPDKDTWLCDSCGASVTKPWPADREKFYAKTEPAHKCPRCKSQSLMPHGF